jgi:hypothetical protein
MKKKKWWKKKFAAWLQFAKYLPPTNFPLGNFSNQFESFLGPSGK